MPKFSLRFLLVFVALFCFIAGIATFTIHSFLAGGRVGQLQRFQSLLSNDPRIEQVSIGGCEVELGQFYVTTVRFKIRGKPDSSIALFVGNSETDLASLSIYQIGNLSPVVLEWDANANAWAPRCPTLGDSEFRPPSVPGRPTGVSDLVSNYDELLNYFEEWPTYPDYRSFTTESGKEFRYYIEPPNVNSKDEFISESEIVRPQKLVSENKGK
jgi:hypothetical protein